MELVDHLVPYVRERGLGAVSGPDGLKRMAGGNWRQPDIAFVGNERLVDGRVESGASGQPPDLAVKSSASATPSRRCALKRTEYFASGVLVVWEIDPRRRTAEVYTGVETSSRVSANGSLDGGALLPGFSLKLPDLFAILADPTERVGE